MKHKYYDMIVAKAGNMDLVVFCNGPCGKSWHVTDNNWPNFSEEFDYFLCLPQHKDAVLNSLNGGVSQLSFGGHRWTECNCNQPVEWNSGWWYMRPESTSRIKPTWRYEVEEFASEQSELLSLDNDLRDCIGDSSLEREFLIMCHLVASMTEKPE